MAKGKSLQQQAASIVAAQLNPQIGAIGQQIKQSQQSEAQGLGDIGKYFGQAGGAINKSQGAVGQETANSVADIARLYGAAGAGQQQAFGQARQGTAGELARLGLQAALPGATKNLNSDANFMQAITKLQGANAGAGAREMGQNTAGMINAIGGETAASGAQSKSDMQREMQRMIDNLTFQKNATEATRGGKEQQVLSGLQQAAAAQANANARLGIEAQNSASSSDLHAAEIYHLLHPSSAGSKSPTTGVLGADSLLAGLGADTKDKSGHIIPGLGGSTVTNYQNEIANLAGEADYHTALGDLNNYINTFALGKQIPGGKGVGTISPRDAVALKTALAMAFKI